MTGENNNLNYSEKFRRKNCSDTGTYMILLVNDGQCDATDFIGIFDANDTINTSVKYFYENGLRLQSGLYFVQIKSGNKLLNTKVLIW